MSRTLISIIDFCENGRIEISFVRDLHAHGLIDIIIESHAEFLDEEQLPHIEKYYSWYEDLELNMQGIEVVRNLLRKIEDLHDEIRRLRVLKP